VFFGPFFSPFLGPARPDPFSSLFPRTLSNSQNEIYLSILGARIALEGISEKLAWILDNLENEDAPPELQEIIQWAKSIKEASAVRTMSSQSLHHAPQRIWTD
jgi:hypothetical protein